MHEWEKREASERGLLARLDSGTLAKSASLSKAALFKIVDETYRWTWPEGRNPDPFLS